MKKHTIGGLAQPLQLLRFPIYGADSQPETMTPGMIPGLTVPPEVFAVPKEPGPPGEREDDRPILSYKDVGRGVLADDELPAFSTFLKNLNPDNALQASLRIREHARERGYSPVQVRSLLRRATAYYKDSGMPRLTAGIRAARTRGFTPDEVPMSADLEKGEPRGGRYHVRIPLPDGGKKYVYDPESYRSRPDAHIRGAEVLQDRLRKELTDRVGTSGAELEDLRRHAVSSKFDAGMFDDTVKGMVASGLVQQQGTRLMPPVGGDVQKGPPPKLTIPAQPAAGDAPMPPIPKGTRDRQRREKTKVLQDAGIVKGLIVKADQYGDRSGEGSRGGHVVGHTSSGKAIYEVAHGSQMMHAVDAAPAFRWVTGAAHPDFTADDHKEAYQHFDRQMRSAHAESQKHSGDTPEHAAALKQARELSLQRHGHDLMHEKLTGEKASTRLHREHQERTRTDEAEKNKRYRESVKDNVIGMAAGKRVYANADDPRHADFTAAEHAMAARLARDKAGPARFGMGTETPEEAQKRVHLTEQVGEHNRMANVKGQREREAAIAAQAERQKKDRAQRRANQKATAAAPPVESGKVRIANDDGSHTDHPAFHERGLYAAHEKPGAPKGQQYVVTHKPTGFATFATGSKRDAKAAVDHFHTEAGEAAKDAAFGKHPDQAHPDFQKIAAAHKTLKAKLQERKAPSPRAAETLKALQPLGDWLSKAGFVEVDQDEVRERQENAADNDAGGDDDQDEDDKPETPGGGPEVEKGAGHVHTAKWDRAVEHVKENSPGVDNPYAVATAALGPTESIQAPHREVEKGSGEGSRGGHVIGHTGSGKAIYASGSYMSDWSRQDHRDAGDAHRKAATAANAAGKTAVGTEHEKAVARHAAVGAKMAKSEAGIQGMQDWLAKAGVVNSTRPAPAAGTGSSSSVTGIPGGTTDGMDRTSGDPTIPSTRGGKGPQEGIPGTEDEGGGKDPAEDLPESEQAMDQGKEVNGQLSMPGMEGGDIGQGEGNVTKAIQGASEDDASAKVGSDPTRENTRGGKGPQEGIPGGEDEGEKDKLSPDDGDLGKMPQGEPGFAGEEPRAGLSGHPQMDVGSMTREEMGKSQPAPDLQRRAIEDPRVRHLQALAERAAHARNDVSIAPGGPSREMEKAAAEGKPLDAAVGIVHYSDVSDREADAFMKSQDANGGYEPRRLDERAMIYKSDLCKACGSQVSAYLSKCDHCGAGMTKAAQDLASQPDALQKSQSVRVTAGRRSLLVPAPVSVVHFPDEG